MPDAGGNFKFGCCCGGGTECLICGPDLVSSGIYNTGQQIGSTCLQVETGTVIASTGQISLLAAAIVRSTVVPADNARKYITVSYDATSTNRMRFGERNNWVEIYRDSSLGKWVVGLCAGGEIDTGTAFQKSQHTGGTTLTELLVEICFQYNAVGGREMRVNIPLFGLYTSIPCGEPFYQYSWIRAVSATVVVKHFETWIHESATDGCKECLIETGDGFCTDYCTDPVVPTSILVTIPTMTENFPADPDHKCSVNNVPCSAMAGTYRLFLQYVPSQDRCFWKVDAPAGCFAANNSTGVTLPVSSLLASMDGLGFLVSWSISGPIRLVSGTYAPSAALWACEWRKPLSGESIPFLCGGRTETVPFDSVGGSIGGGSLANYCKPSPSSAAVIRS
jgi:hypothetical protein